MESIILLSSIIVEILMNSTDQTYEVEVDFNYNGSKERIPRSPKEGHCNTITEVQISMGERNHNSRK